MQDQNFYHWGSTWNAVPSSVDGTFASIIPRDLGVDLFLTQHRDYSSNQGRWITPDPENAGADPSDPQSWNAYAYVRNNPTTLTDPKGDRYQVCQSDPNGNQANCADISDFQFAEFEQENHNLFTFTGGDTGNILHEGNVVGTFQQTSVDLPQNAQTILSRVHQIAAGPVNFFGNATMGFLAVLGPGILESSLAVPEIAGLGLGVSGRPAGQATRPSAPPDLSNLSPKIQGQMTRRGWTPQDIENVFRNGVPSQQVDRTAGFTPATQYLEPATGRFIVVNNATGKVIQVSDVGFRPNPPVR